MPGDAPSIKNDQPPTAAYQQQSAAKEAKFDWDFAPVTVGMFPEEVPAFVYCWIAFDVFRKKITKAACADTSLPIIAQHGIGRCKGLHTALDAFIGAFVVPSQ